MKELLVMGIGSRIMADDAIGILIVEDLEKYDNRAYIAYTTGETDIDYCVEEALKYNHIIVIDAFLSGKQPGEVSVIPMNELDKSALDNLYSLHGLHLLNILCSLKNSPKGILIGIEPYEINYGFTLSDLLQSSYTTILSEVSGQIDLYIEESRWHMNA